MQFKNFRQWITIYFSKWMERSCVNTRTQKDYIERDDTASPTAITDSILKHSNIDPKHIQEIVAAIIANTFVILINIFTWGHLGD